MKAVKRWRYYCDHCPKAGMSSYHMQRHESSCTLNPERKCRMCDFGFGGQAATTPELMAVLPDPAPFYAPDQAYLNNEPTLDNEAFRAALSAAMANLRELCQDCPVCIMAALRQKKIPVPLAEGFDFKKECDAVFAMVAAERAEMAGYPMGYY